MSHKRFWKIESLWEKSDRSPSAHMLEQRKNITQKIQERFFMDGSHHSFGFQKVSEFDFTPTIEPVFVDHDGSYTGLQNRQYLSVSQTSYYLSDNHNLHLVPIYHMYSILQRPLNILHIDAHRDDADYHYIKPREMNTSTLQQLMNTTRISDFYDALGDINIITRLTRVTSSHECIDFLSSELDLTSYDLLTFDVDFFGKEGEFTDLETKIAVIARAYRFSTVIAFATSPGFIPAGEAQNIIQIFSS